ncbi:MAG: hypothetical protein Edafosvirus25_12 [Edafosvirus sp.]|uniref:Uncharacterized protein n=1 Tax=Edafosvirus sp. TaxID=2487765 RepID=A0A3G4ZUW6_9VIRU|nr:MAG: hypothetical protein Edafosvirus25_12 [Edafosvirus sp.]
MTDIENIDYDSLQDYDPETIAQIIFGKNPDKPCSHQILSLENDAGDASYIFEIILTIFMEGIMKLYNNLDGVDLNHFNEDYLLALQPWLHSLVFNLKIEKCLTENIEKYGDYYCKIATKNHKEYETYFQNNDLPKKYRFFLNPIYANECKKEKLDDLYATFIINDTVYILRFNFYQFS